VDTAIPLGLIANELVCNSLKHAFTGRPAGHMRISLSQIDHGRLQLEVQDDGKGLPSGFDPDKTSSLGVRLVKILSGQINGKMDFNGENGARFAVSFDLAQPKIKT
jgi:two-component sensor histidine kinase